MLRCRRGVALRLAADSALPLATDPRRGDPTRVSVSGGPLRQPDVLNTAELASLWQLPSDTGGVPGGKRVVLFGVSESDILCKEFLTERDGLVLDPRRR